MPINILNLPESSTCFSAGSADAVLGVVEELGVAFVLAAPSKDDADEVVAITVKIDSNLLTAADRRI